MLGWFRPRLTYANVVATLALFVALGGGAYATFSLPANSVGTKQLKDRAVTPNKLSGSTVRFLTRGSAGFSYQDNGNGGSGVSGSFEPVLTLNTGSQRSGFIELRRRSRVIANAALTWIGTVGANVHVDCFVGEAVAGSTPEFTGLTDNMFVIGENSLTITTSSEYRDMPVDGAFDLDPGKYDVQVLCANRAAGTGSGELVRGQLTVTASPL
jgi:hypothetical protein